MNGYFIHTIELSKNISYEEFENIKNTMHCFPKNKGSKKYNWRSTCYKSSGIIIDLRRRTDKEMYSGDYDSCYNMELIINPSRLLVEDTYTNKIHTTCDFQPALKKLNETIKILFANKTHVRDINSFRLHRIDITKDIQNIPEHLIQEYILLARRMRHYAGYKFNEKLENNCDKFRKEDSLNLLNKSQGIEFVIYNKHRAAEDMRYNDAIKYYADTLRMELRCNRKFIKKRIKKSWGTIDELYTIYNHMHEIFKGIFYKVFFEPSLCYVSDELLKTIIWDSYGKKYSKIIKMLGFAKLVRSGEEMTIDDAISEIECSYKVKSNLLSYFDEIKLSPLNIGDRNISFLQSLESLLEMTEPSPYEIKYFKLAAEKSDDIPFFHRKTISSTEDDVFALFG